MSNAECVGVRQLRLVLIVEVGFTAGMNTPRRAASLVILFVVSICCGFATSPAAEPPVPLALEAQVKGAWVKVLGIDQRRLLGQGPGGDCIIPATAPLRLTGDLSAHVEYVEAAVDFGLTEVPPPSESAKSAGWRAVGIRTFAEWAAGPSGRWRPASPEKAVLVCLWQVAGRPVAIHTLPLQNYTGKGFQGKAHTFELPAEAAMGNPVFLLLEDGQPLRKRVDAANATADRLGVLAALGQDETVAAELLRLGAVPASAKGEPTLLHQAAQAGALRSLETLIHLGAVTKSKTSAGDTPLHLAARNGRTAIVERLIAAKAPLNADNAMKDTPLHLAAGGCHAEACRLLVEAGASVHASNDRDQTPLFRALLADCTPAVELLMARRGDFGFNDFIRDRLLVRKASSGQRRLVQILLSRHADPNASWMGQPALLVASREGHAGIVSELLAAKANPNATGEKGVTPLIAAASRGRVAIVRQLLEAGASPDAETQSGFTALHAASFAGSSATVEVLLAAGVRVDSAGAQGGALALALGAGARDTVVRLLDAGAKVDPASPRFEEELTAALAMDADVFLAAALKEGMSADWQTAKGWSALQLALVGKSDRCAALLRAAGAREPDPVTTSLVPGSKLEKRPALVELHPTIDPRDPQEGDFAASTVLVDTIVGPDGVPAFARASCEDCRLSLSAVQTVLHSRFQPALKDGVAVASQVRIPIIFNGREEQTFDVNTLDVRPELLSSVDPAYPASELARGINGQAVLQFVVDENGRVGDVVVLSATDSSFGENAAAALRQWRFKPGLRDGQAVASRMSVPLYFRVSR